LRRPIPGATLSGVRRARRGTAEPGFQEPAGRWICASGTGPGPGSASEEVESERKRGWLKPTGLAR
jgi:hypothetical protein